MNKILIEKKYNKQLNIFLGIYITLCLIFALLFNGFFIKPKAFSNGESWEVTGTNINSAGYGTDTRTVRITSSGRTKAIYYTDREFIDLLNQKISSNNQTDITASCVMIRARDRDLGGSFSEEVVSTSGGGSVPALRGGSLFIDRGSDLYNYFVNSGYELEPISGRSYQVSYYVNGTVDTAPFDLYSAEFASDVQYVDNAKDLYKYLVEDDDSVVNVGNPDEIPQSPEDNSLPLPQQLKFIEVSNKDYATSVDKYSVQVGWSNPQSASFDAFTNIRAEIKYKVKLKAQSGTLFLNKGTYTTDFVDSTFKLSDSAISNHYVTKYVSVGYAQPNENIPSADKNPKYYSGITNYIYQDSLLNGAMLQVISANDLKYFPLYTYNIIEGTQLSMRYIGTLNGKDYASLWVTVNYSGTMVTKDKITFENASGDPVSPDDVDYNNSSDTYTNNNDTWSITGFFQNLSASVSSVFSSISEFFSSGDNGNSSFYKFFSKVFTEFPGFFAMFFIGLGIAIILRILGR